MIPLPVRALIVAAFAVLSASPALAVDEYGQPTGATPEEAKTPVGKEFDPASQNLNIPAPDPRFTNNPALNKLIAPEEETAPSLAEQDQQKWEEDFTNPLSAEEKAEALKEQAREERRNVSRIINPSKARSLAPEPSEEEEFIEEEADLSALPALQEDPIEPDMGLENGGQELPPPLPDPEDTAVKERSSDEEYGIVKTDKGTRYKRPETGTSKSGRDTEEAPEETDGAEAPEEETVEMDITEEEAAALGLGAAMGRPVTAITEGHGRAGGKSARKGASRAGKKGGSGGGKSSGKSGGRGMPGEPRPEKITPDQRQVEKLFDLLNE